MLEQVFLARFEPLVARFGPWKIPESLENRPFQHQKWVKNGSKKHFSKSDPRPYGMVKEVVLPILRPLGRVLAHGKGQIALKMGRCGAKNGSKLVQKSAFPKVILGHLGCSNKCF